MLSYFDLISSFGIEYNTQDYYTYYKLTASIPDDWVHRLERNGNSVSDEDLRDNQGAERKDWSVLTDKDHCRKAYTLLIQKLFHPPLVSQGFWITKLEMETEVNWTKYYENAYYCTLETKLRSFQIKLFLKCIVFNNTLHEFGLVDSDKCVFCKTDTEDIMHSFITVHM